MAVNSENVLVVIIARIMNINAARYDTEYLPDITSCIICSLNTYLSFGTEFIQTLSEKEKDTEEAKDCFSFPDYFRSCTLHNSILNKATRLNRPVPSFRINVIPQLKQRNDAYSK
jgi:hypothetical protein